MGVTLESGLVGSILEPVPLIGYIQSRFDIDSAQNWLGEHWYYSVIASLIYVSLLWLGQKWMSERPAFDLCHLLLMWNIGLAVFSVFGMLSIAPNLVHSVFRKGIEYSVCHGDTLIDPQQAIWAFLFVAFKIIEFGDTAFVVLRKRPLTFLHWYHHMSVCIYSFYGLSHSKIAAGALARWCGGMNYIVHSVMYSYYALKAARVRVPSYVALSITIMQVAQMFIALYVNVMNYVLSQQLGKEACECNDNIFKASMIIYGSYALLFLKYFYGRYCTKKIKKE